MRKCKGGYSVSKQQKNKGISGQVIRTLAFLVVIVLGYQGIKLAKISQGLDLQIKEAQKEVAVESDKLEYLKLEYENIESIHTVERMAREKLGLVKEDEIVFREKY